MPPLSGLFHALFFQRPTNRCSGLMQCRHLIEYAMDALQDYAAQDLREDQWERVKDSLPGKAGDRGRSGCDNRGFIRAVMCIARKGAPW